MNRDGEILEKTSEQQEIQEIKKEYILSMSGGCIYHDKYFFEAKNVNGLFVYDGYQTLYINSEDKETYYKSSRSFICINI